MNPHVCERQTLTTTPAGTTRRLRMCLHRRQLAAAVLYGGWLLMIPPGKDERPDIHAPMTGWVQLRAFDSARECEALRSEFITRLHRLHAEREKVVGKQERTAKRPSAGRATPNDSTRTDREPSTDELLALLMTGPLTPAVAPQPRESVLDTSVWIANGRCIPVEQVYAPQEIGEPRGSGTQH